MVELALSQQIDRLIEAMMQIPGSWDLGILNASYTLKNALQAMGITISSEQAYRKVVQYANTH